MRSRQKCFTWPHATTTYIRMNRITQRKFLITVTCGRQMIRERKKTVLLYIMKEVGINPSDLELELVPMNDNAISDNVED